MKDKWRPGRGMVWVLVGVRGYVLWPTRHSLVTLFSLSVSVKDWPLHWMIGKSQTYYPKHILGMCTWKTCYSLVMDFGSFRTDCHGGFWVRRSLHRTESGTQGRGLRVQVWTGTWTP